MAHRRLTGGAGRCRARPRAGAHPAARAYKEALVADGIPVTSFAVDDVQAEFDRLSGKGVSFVQPPTPMGPVMTAVLDDTCGNLIQIASQPAG